MLLLYLFTDTAPGNTMSVTEYTDGFKGTTEYPLEFDGQTKELKQKGHLIIDTSFPVLVTQYVRLGELINKISLTKALLPRSPFPCCCPHCHVEYRLISLTATSTMNTHMRNKCFNRHKCTI